MGLQDRYKALRYDPLQYEIVDSFTLEPYGSADTYFGALALHRRAEKEDPGARWQIRPLKEQ